MILPFSTKMSNGKFWVKTYFIDKIWDCIEEYKLVDNLLIVSTDYIEAYLKKFGKQWDHDPEIKPKLHTIREDAKNRWKAGNKIHFVVFNRSKNQVQFAPVLPCISTQNIEIKWEVIGDIKKASIYVDELPVGTYINSYSSGICRVLAKNYGFNDVDDFFAWFSEDFTGKIIHWTDLKY